MVKLDCGHTFHFSCLSQQVKAKWPGKRMSFGYITCGLCRKDLEITECEGAKDEPRCVHAARRMRVLVDKHKTMRDRVYKLCYESAKFDGSLDGMKESEIKNYVDTKIAAFLCTNCDQPFCGGKVECADSKLEADKLMCQSCSFVNSRSSHKCKKHGVKYAVFKCNHCCSIATFDCSGNHYCDTCHRSPSDRKKLRAHCRGRPEDKCPLSIPHPLNVPRNHGKTKTGFVVGCTKCLGISEYCETIVSRQTQKLYKDDPVKQPKQVKKVG